MVYNQLVPKSIFPEFANFKKIVFGKHHGEEEQIGFKFYKNDNFEDSELEEFHRHIVPRGMLEEIIKNGKLRVTHIVVCHFLPDDRSTDIHELGEMNSFKAFCALFLGKQIQISDGQNNNLMIEKFSIHESVGSIQKNFETILAIDAVELEMSNNDDVLMLVRMDFSQYKSSIIANNTTKISIHCQVDVHFFIFKQIREKFATNFEALCSFLIRICPNLKHLRVIIHLSLNVDSIDFSIDEFTDNLHFTIATIEAVIKSINIGDEHLQISIHFIAEFPSYIYKKLPLGSTDLFKPFAFFLSVGNRDDKIVSSHFMPPFNDARGRIHQFFFTSLRDESDFDKDDSMDTSDDDNDDEEEDGDEDEDGEEDGNNEEEDGDEEDEVGDEEEEDDEDEVGNTDEDEVGDVEFDYEDEPY